MGQPRAGKHVLEDKEGVGEGAAFEKDPGDGAQKEGDPDLEQDSEPAVLRQTQPAAHPGAQIGGKTADHLIKPVEEPPGYKGQGGAVPQAADGKDDEEICIRSHPPSAAPAQRDIEVVPEPGGEGDVPAPPELPDGAGEVGRAEVFHQPETQHLGAAQGHIRVSGEVAVNLNGKGGGGRDDLEAAKLIRRGIYGGDQHAQAVGNDQLFKSTP